MGSFAAEATRIMDEPETQKKLETEAVYVPNVGLAKKNYLNR